jgi:hypothetical protein
MEDKPTKENPMIHLAYYVAKCLFGIVAVFSISNLALLAVNQPTEWEAKICAMTTDSDTEEFVCYLIEANPVLEPLT